MAIRLERLQAPTAAKFLEAFRPEIVGRNCKLEEYRKKKVPEFKIKGEFIAYASPDSTYAVTRRMLDSARRSILIGIYDFTAGYVKEDLLRAMRRGVDVTLMLDLDGRSGETELFDELVEYGCTGVSAPSCANPDARYFASSHEKVIVVDNEWVLVQSGNYSDASIPDNEVDGGDPENFSFGNRDMGVVVQSPELAKYFAKVLKADIKLSLDASVTEGVSAEGLAALDELEAFGARPTQPAPKLFSSKSFRPENPVSVQPILTPDNYMLEIPGFLQSATKSILIEQQYIRPRQEMIQQLLQVIADRLVENSELDVRIVLGHPTKSADREDIVSLKDYGLKMGKHIRLISPKHFVHCHNKAIIVDRTAALISSQNWSDYAVSRNREAGLLIRYSGIAEYFAEIFEVDWNTGVKKLKAETPELFGPESLASGKTVRLSFGDYVDV